MYHAKVRHPEIFNNYIHHQNVSVDAITNSYFHELCKTFHVVFLKPISQPVCALDMFSNTSTPLNNEHIKSNLLKKVESSEIHVHVSQMLVHIALSKKSFLSEIPQKAFLIIYVRHKFIDIFIHIFIDCQRHFISILLMY